MVNGEVWLSDHDVVQVTPSQVPGVTIGPRCWVSVRLTMAPPPPSDSVQVTVTVANLSRDRELTAL